MKRSEVALINELKIIKLAFETKDFEILKAHILAGDIDINYNPYNRSDYHYLLSKSVESNCLEFYEFLFQNGVYTHSMIILYPSYLQGCMVYNLLDFCCIHTGYLEFAKLYIKYGGNVNVLGERSTPLMNSIKYNHTELTILLVEYKADVNRRGDLADSNYTPLELSVVENKYDICRLLIEHKADINFENSNPLNLVDQYSKEGVRIFNLLFYNGANIKPSTPADVTLAMLEGLMLNLCEGLKTITPFYKLDSYTAQERSNPDIVEALKFYAKNPLYRMYGNYFKILLYSKEKLEKCIKFIPGFLELISQLKDCNFPCKLFTANKIDEVLETYEVATPLQEIEQLIENDTFDLEHFSIFDYGDHDFS